MKIEIEGSAKEIAALVLAVQERQKTVKPSKDECESMIKTLENRVSKLKRLSSRSPLEIL